MLKQRIITACALVVLVGLVLFVLPHRVFAFFMALVFTLAAWEWANLAGIMTQTGRIVYALAFAPVFVSLALADIQPSDIVNAVLIVAVFGWIAALCAVLRYPMNKRWCTSTFLMVAGIWLLLPAFVSLLVLKPLMANSGLVVLVIGSIAAADIGAYFVGRRLGKTKLAAAVSPGKTWEGFWGGGLVNLLLMAMIGVSRDMPAITFVFFLLLMVVTAAASVLGDLFESLVKRERGIKDSSQLLPGHGGVLDRIDGWTAALPVFTLFYLLLR